MKYLKWGSILIGFLIACAIFDHLEEHKKDTALIIGLMSFYFWYLTYFIEIKHAQLNERLDYIEKRFFDNR